MLPLADLDGKTGIYLIIASRQCALEGLAGRTLVHKNIVKGKPRPENLLYDLLQEVNIHADLYVPNFPDILD
jgi:hypothetical protein